MFEPQLWLKFKLELAALHQRCGSPYEDSDAAKALKPQPAIIEHYQNESAQHGHELAIMAQRTVAARDQLLVEFTEKMKSGKFVASGILRPDPARKTIPAHLWSELTPNIPDGIAAGSRFTFEDVRVALATPRTASRADKHLDWMRRHWREIRGLTKKQIQPMAESALGADFRVREFNVAYSEVFERKTGRPRNRTIEKKDK